MFLLYVRLFNRDEQPAFPQKNFNRSGQQNHSSNQKACTRKAHQEAVERLRHVQSNYALERRLFP